jgi:hypothetical protein
MAPFDRYRHVVIIEDGEPARDVPPVATHPDQARDAHAPAGGERIGEVS